VAAARLWELSPNARPYNLLVIYQHSQGWDGTLGAGVEVNKPPLPYSIVLCSSLALLLSIFSFRHFSHFSFPDIDCMRLTQYTRLQVL
jgi:hypothetical protein